MCTYIELDDEGSDEHTQTLYQIPQYVDEGSSHIDILLLLPVRVPMTPTAVGVAVTPTKAVGVPMAATLVE